MEIKASLSLLITLVLSLVCAQSAQAAIEYAHRQEMRLMDDWRFKKGSVEGADAASFNDSTWETLRLPHTWNIADGSDGGSFYQGDAWYRRRFQVPATWAGKRVFLQFDGANRSAEVFLNGHRLGLHRGGYARFRFDATGALNLNGVNVLAVRVNNDPKDNIIPVSADYTFFGGIYRAVSLVATEQVHIEMLDYASPGAFVNQSKVTPDSAELDLKVKLANDTENASDLTVSATLLADGTQVQKTESKVALAPRARGEANSRFVVLHPRLWNAKVDPYLYHMRIEVSKAGTVRDSVTLPVGLRYFSVDPSHGFSLNGQYLDLHGVNRHQERAGKGWAISEAEEREDFDLIEEIGANMVRQSHYQQSQLWNDLGDGKGMIMWAEIPYTNDVRDSRDFVENAKEQLRELIRQNHHHAAILFWSIGNETFVRDPKVMPADSDDRMLRELSALVRQEDPSRLSTYASNGDVTEPRAGIPDVLGFNHYFGWYHGNPVEFAPWLDAQHALRPDLRLGISEYGAGANVTHHEEPAHRPVPTGQWHPEEWQAIYHEVHWQAMSERPWLWCKLIWNMFDFASDGRNEGGTPGINDKGLVSQDRKIRKDAFYYYEANWGSHAMLHITSQRFVERTQATTPVKIYSNAESVELFLNGVSLGSKTSANRIFLWPEVTLQKGSNAIDARATIDGHKLSDRCTWNYSPAAPAKPAQTEPTQN